MYLYETIEMNEAVEPMKVDKVDEYMVHISWPFRGENVPCFLEKDREGDNINGVCYVMLICLIENMTNNLQLWI